MKRTSYVPESVRGATSSWGTDNSLKVVLVSQHPVVRQSLRQIMEREADLDVVAEARDIEEAAVASRALRPDVVVLDVALAGDTGVAVICQTCAQMCPPRVVMLGMSADREHVMHALRAGACGYLRTQDAAEELVIAVRTASPERVFLGAAIEREDIMAEIEATRRQATVLVVEDDPDFVDIVKTTLESARYQVLVAGNKEDGLRLLRSEHPDAVILDVMMPEGTEGFHFVWELRQDSEPAIRETPILMLTGIHDRSALRFYPEQADGTYGPFEYLPVQDFLDKPVEPALLLQRVRQLLSQRDEQQKAS
jgi:DNA-binding NarL/FixJ family response regulator